MGGVTGSSGALLPLCVATLRKYEEFDSASTLDRDHMRKIVPTTVSDSIPAAQYVRMSDDGQQYSIDNQKAAIQEYAKHHGFVVVRTYADAGKSGVVLNRRESLQKLLEDVDLGKTDFKAILVYDVSRWGRFQNSDEAAHYEFLCTRSGIRLHYCAEQFANDDTPSSAILKALKRSMAAEFSRELGVKVFEGKSRLVKLGFWVGGPPGYGYRRMMVSASGKPKQKLKSGEHKSLTTDRVILVPGPRKEVECVRRMFAMVVEHRLGCTAIARELNRDGVSFYGGQWTNKDVFDVLTHPKYAGWNTWHRTSQKLRSNVTRVKPDLWILRQGAFAPIVDQSTFDEVQAKLPRNADRLWSDQELLNKLKRLLAAKGKLTESLILKARGMPSTHTLRTHFGSYGEMYSLVGYHPPAKHLSRSAQGERTKGLRREIVDRISSLFPEHIAVHFLPNRTRPVLRLDGDVIVSLMLCRPRKRKRGRVHWLVEPAAAERQYVTLLCTLSHEHDRVQQFYVFPPMQLKSHRAFENDPWLRTGVRLKDLSEFYKVARTIHEAQYQVTPAES
jgi:DNA invertase Pin-like site-specific DNA recombinase